MSLTSTGGAVYDRGYRPYEGPRGGRRAAVIALWKASMRRAVGLRRSWRQKVMPWTLLGIVTIPAIVNVGIGYVTRNTPVEDFEFITYRDYVGVSTMLLIFAAVTAPDVVSPDRRYRVLPLIFARPLSGADYVLAKLGSIFTVIFAFSYLPQVVLFVGQMLVSDESSTYLRENAEVLWQVPVAVAALSLYFAAITVSVASFTTRRVVGGVAILAIFLVTSTVSAIMVETNGGGPSAAALIDLIGLPLNLRDVIFLGEISTDSDLSGVQWGGALALVVYVVIVASCIVALLRRYSQGDS